VSKPTLKYTLDDGVTFEMVSIEDERITQEMKQKMQAHSCEHAVLLSSPTEGNEQQNKMVGFLLNKLTQNAKVESHSLLLNPPDTAPSTYYYLAREELIMGMTEVGLITPDTHNKIRTDMRTIINSLDGNTNFGDLIGERFNNIPAKPPSGRKSSKKGVGRE
jgi:hypothetical protein